MFERFTEESRQVVVRAQEEARRLSHNFIGTEHVLLGLLANKNSKASVVLDNFDVEFEQVRDRVVELIGEGEEVYEGQIPFTPKGKAVLEFALREALSLGSNYIKPEHILLGLVSVANSRFNTSTAIRILKDLGANKEELHAVTVQAIKGEPLSPPSGSKESIQLRLDAAVERRERETKKIRKLREQLKNAQKQD